MAKFIPCYSLPANYDKEQERKQELQKHCPHTYWATKCGICCKILGSDVQVNHHTAASFKLDNRVAIVRASLHALTPEAVEALTQLRLQYDELTVLVPAGLTSLYAALKCVSWASTRSLSQEIAHMKKYRSNDVVHLSIITKPTKAPYAVVSKAPFKVVHVANDLCKLI